MAKLTNIAIVPSPGMGHLIPLAEFARVLALTQPSFRVTVIVPTIGQPTETVKSTLASLPITVRHVYLPPVTFGDSPPPLEVLMSATMSRSAPHLREALKGLMSDTTDFSALVFDMFSSEFLDSVKDFGIRSYVFFPASAMMLSFCFYLPELDRVVSGEYRDLPDPVQIPGCFPIHGRDLPDPVQNRKGKFYDTIIRLANRLTLVDGIMVNSFAEMEGRAFRALAEAEGVPPVYPVGPVANDGSGGQIDGSGCLDWLDGQESGSVLFVSFGSGGTLSRAQLDELALGLENSGQKFLWVVRKPNDTSASAAYHFRDEISVNPLEFLPRGFLERTEGRGLVVPDWAPQAQVLNHDSVGGFLTHCGWSSTLESIVNGKPLIVWPLHAEQKTNAVLLSEHLNVGLRPKVNGDGIVQKEEVSEIVKALMEGEKGKLIRKRMKLLQNGAKKASSEDGDSTKTLAELALEWTK